MDPFRTVYRELSDEEKQLMVDVKSHASALLDVIKIVPAGREQSLAITKLEETVMWVVKGITG